MYTSGYRKLLKSACVLFKQDDYALNNFKKVLREEFVKNKMVVDPLLLVQCSKDIEEADELLRFRLVQGKKNERGNFSVKLQPEHHVTIEHGQDNPNGPELEPVDQSYIGRNVVINKSKKGDKPMERKK